jgi:hypothetical protein
MGAEQSEIITGTYKDNFGYRVVGLKPGGPADLASIEPFIDFIVYKPVFHDGRSLLLSEYLNMNLGKQVVLRVYNLIQ